MKTIVKDMIFIVIFLVLLHFATNIFVLKGNSYGSDVISFYEQKKNSLDIIFFGSSHSYATFSPKVIKQETGLNSYNFATQQQPIYITYHYMIEALKTQKPKYFVLETKMLSVDSDYTSEGVIRDALDKMHFSKNKLNAINVSIENKKETLSYIINIIKYHTRYKEITKKEIYDSILGKGINNLGFKYLDQNEDIIINNKDVLKVKETLDISAKNLEYLQKIIALAKKNNIKLVLVKSPCLLTEEEQKKYNKVAQMANRNNIDFINYNFLHEELKLKKGDFFDIGHLSGAGATKVSKSFSNYILNED